MAEINGSPSVARNSSDTDSDVEKKMKKYRRKRGNGRYRPYSVSPSTPEQEGKDSVHRPEIDRGTMAPSNTTQFLLEDREARSGVHIPEEYIPVYESNSARPDSSASGDEIDHVQGSSSDDESSFDREFESSCLEVKRERVEKLSKLQLEQELLERDYDADLLSDKCRHLDSENRHLRELLSANGIEVGEAVVSSTSSVIRQGSKSPRVSAN